MGRGQASPRPLEERIQRKSTYIREPLEVGGAERGWQHGHLKQRLRIMDLDQLFETYVHRLRHVMLVNFLLVQLALAALYTSVLLATTLSPDDNTVALLNFISINHQGDSCSSLNSTTTSNSRPWDDELVLPELLAYSITFFISFVLLIVFYNETCFRAHPKWHSVLGLLMTLYILGMETAVTLHYYFKDGNETRLKFGNPQYALVVVYVFLPFSDTWHLVGAGALTSSVHLGLEAALYLREGDPPVQHIALKLVLKTVFLLWCSLVGLFSRRLTNIAFLRAFLDKRGSLETKFKLESAKKQEENLLLSILPKNIMHAVKKDFREQIDNIHSKPSAFKTFTNLYVNRHNEVSILYADICNFTILTTRLKVGQLVELLNDLFGKFDEAAEDHFCLRIKILGDCYYCVSGVPEYTRHHAVNCVKMGFDMIDIIRDVREERKVDVDMRIGIHSGSVLSGLIGARKWQFDVWSNDVTVANHMEQTGKAGHVHISQQTRNFLPPDLYDYIPHRARINDKLLDKENIDTFLVILKKKGGRRVSQFTGATINPQHVRFQATSGDLDQLYHRTEAIGEIEAPPGVPETAIRTRSRSTIPVAVNQYRQILGNSKDFMRKAVEGMPFTKIDQWFRSETINPFLLTFRTRQWGASFTRQPDPLFKYYLLCSAAVCITIFTSQQALFPSLSVSLYVGLFLLLLYLVLLPTCWLPSLYMRYRDPHRELYLSDEDTGPVLSRCLHSDKLVVTSFGVRVAIFLVISAGLFVVALANLSQCQEEINNNKNLSDASSLTFNNSALYATYQELNTLENSSLPLNKLVRSVTSSFSVSNNSTDSSIPTTWSTSLHSRTFSVTGSNDMRTASELAKRAAREGYESTISTGSEAMTPVQRSNAASTCDDMLLLCDTWFFTDSLSLAILAVWAFFRVNFFLKLLAYLTGLALYVCCVVIFAKDVYSQCSHMQCSASLVSSHSLTPAITHLLLVVSLVFALHVMDRQMEYIMRLDFQWKQQLESEQQEAEETHMANKILLRNILPQHVAEKFLNSGFQDELYHESYNHVAVMFASIPNYAEFYKEHEFNEEGKGCLGVLNEIIVDFDMLTYKLNFLSIEKIKVVGSTYMAACGLQPGKLNSDDAEFEERDRRDNVATLAAFASAMIIKLDTINKESYQNFGLRIGIDVGPVIAGVIGSQKPLYDIWGNTVNVASRMDYTGAVGKIHVTSTVGEILEDLGWSVDCRGEIDVKGKGKMVTYFVDPRSAPKRKVNKASDITALGKLSARARQNRQTSDASLTKKPSLASIKSMLESKKGSFDLQATTVRHSSLPSVPNQEFNSQAASSALHKTLPSKLKCKIRGGLPESLTAVEGTSFRELSVLDGESRSSLESVERTERLKRQDKTETKVEIESENNGVGTSKEYSTGKGFTPSKEKKTHKLNERIRKKYYLSLEKFSEYEEDSYLSKISGDSSSSSGSEPNLSMRDISVSPTAPLTTSDGDEESQKSNVRVTLEKDATGSTENREGTPTSSTSSSEGKSLETSNQEHDSSVIHILETREGRTSLRIGQFNPSTILDVELRDRDGGT